MRVAIGCIALWMGSVWLFARPQAWHVLATVLERISYGTWMMFEIARLHEAPSSPAAERGA